MGGLDINYRDGEQLFLLEELQSIMRNLDEVRGRLTYLAPPVREMSRLHKNEFRRHETDGGHCYTCGSPIETLVKDGYHEVPYWVWNRLEHNEKNYYLVGCGSVEMVPLSAAARRVIEKPRKLLGFSCGLPVCFATFAFKGRDVDSLSRMNVKAK